MAAKQQLDDTVLKINNSFAATVINGSTVAGGLVGACDSSLQVNTSYADFYVHGGDGSKTAGLVGDVATTAAASVELADCYAAGFLYGASTYGLAGGNVKAATNVYTICASVNGAMQYSTASSIGTMSKVYFVHSGAAERGDVSGTNSMAGMGNAELLANLGGEGGQFTIDTTSSSHPYNLMGQALTTYAYPRLYANDHYGDWEAEFASGGLVYYEKYGENDYGFFGSNISTLNDGGIAVGDGYGIVYEAGDNLPDTVTVSMEGFDQSYVIKPKSDPYYESSDGTESKYRIYPLPREWMNVAPDDDSPSLWRVVVTEAAPGETTNAYYYNPHFAKTQQKEQATDAERPVLGVGGQIAVRSPRQLFSLSRYYDRYHDATVGLTFAQELDIAYTAYEWRDFYDPEVTGGIMAMQEPIGGGEYSFDANYDGRCHWITGVCFETASSDYVGMFGYNNGMLSNIVLRNEYGTDLQRFIHRMAVIGQNQHVYMGVLAGYNAESTGTSGGVIVNCAASGYSMTGPLGMISAYSNSTLYVGGLVGMNAGIVQNSSSDCPSITVSAFNARAYVGGFVGRNEGTGSISDCYDLGHVEASYSRGGSVSLAGFAGYNEGDIRASYCATSLLASGESAHTHGFAPRGGAVSASRYLSNGTFEYLGLIRSYNFNSDTSGTATTRGVLCHQRGTSWATEGYAHDYAAGYVAHGDGYPYRAVVRDASGNWVHYGSWQDDVNMGGLGVFYWEHEEGGSNDGYHFTYWGVDGQEAIGGTTLCTAHDDGGLVTEYGYGYFAKSLLDSNQDSGSNTTPNVDFSMDDDNLGFTGGGEGQVNEAAKSDLERQMGGLYTFYPYATRSDSDPDASGRLYLSSDNPEVREGSFELSYDGETYVFEIAPYFADAMRYEAGGFSLVGTDGKESNYAEKAGSAANEYEVRSLQQLQYINWNSETKNNSTFCKDRTYQSFPYLQYADSIVKGKQNEANVYANRSRQCWRQTHDVGTDKSRVFKYTPIAASSSASKKDSWEVVLYTWFGGDYEGGSYKIQNVDIASDSYTVGLFGVVVGANMHDIIMYSDTEKGSTITRVTTEDEGQVGTNPGAYSLGGLVGLAYDYNTTATTNVISNCAISGYNIVDASSKRHLQGGGTVGGLFGVANVKLENCSAVTTVRIECTHDRGAAKFGNYIRVGGLTGSAQYTVDNCYAGGEIKVDPRTVNELYDKNGQLVTDPAARASGNYTREQNVHIYVGGISGSAYTCNYFNFTGDTDSHDGQPVFSNCYSYVKLPNIEGTIKGVSYIAGPADRFGINKAAITIINCRYLDTVNGGVTFTPTEYWFTKGTNSPGTDVEYRRRLLDDESMQREVLADFLNGDLKANKQLLYPDSGSAKRYPTADPNPKPISYDELKANRSAGTGEVVFGPPWGAVKTEEGGVEVHGKYIFPGGNRPDLTGKDYPFPTVVTQDGDWVHYGAWPLNGASWSAGMATIDIFRDMRPDGENPGSDAGRAQVTFVLRDP
ncbi:MAG: hypothetical protein IJH04_04010, partial [Eggerthellaceae bacterium]|nr:hypothetical protein [Eggerthellaceae bacterium]